MSRHLPVPQSYWVEHGSFLAGEYPGSDSSAATLDRLGTLLESGVGTFIDLTEPGELEPYEDILMVLARDRNLTVQYTRLPIPDFGTPSTGTMKAILTEIDRGLKEGRTLYVHCWGGVGRTGTVVGCYLRQHGMNGEQALEQLARWWSSVPKRSVHPQSPETAEQRRFIVEWDTPA